MATRWTDEETALLGECAPRSSSWEQLASHFSRRDAEACRNKARRLGWKGILGSGTPTCVPDSDVPHSEAPETPPALARLLESPSFKAEEWLDCIEELKRLADQAEPIVTSADVEIDTDQPIALMPTSCWHLGSRWVDYPAFRSLFKRTLETPRVYWGLHGDLTDQFQTTFPNASPVLQQLVHPKFQRRLAAFLLGQLAREGRLLYGCAGNHEDFLVRVIGEDLMAPEFQTRRIPYFVGKGVVRLRVGEQLYVLGVAHKWPGSSMYNPVHAETRALFWELPQADLVVGGHKHSFAHQEIRHHILAHDAGLIPSPIVHLVQIGTAASGPDPYAIKGWSRGVFEWPIFALYPREHMVKRIYDWDDMRYFLGL